MWSTCRPRASPSWRFGLGEARLAVARGVPPSVHEAALEADTIGEELGEQLLAATRGTFAEEQTRPLVAGGSLFGAVVISSTGRVR